MDEVLGSRAKTVPQVNPHARSLEMVCNLGIGCDLVGNLLLRELHVDWTALSVGTLLPNSEDLVRRGEEKFENKLLSRIPEPEAEFWHLNTVDVQFQLTEVGEPFPIENRQGLRNASERKAKMYLTWSERQDSGTPPPSCSQIQVSFVWPTSDCFQQGCLARSWRTGDDDLSKTNPGWKRQTPDSLKLVDLLEF